MHTQNEIVSAWKTSQYMYDVGVFRTIGVSEINRPATQYRILVIQGNIPHETL
jgi:diketogulonate reductase-like aldo/keto reductase